ncbi:MAG: acyl-CoA dehydrogenase family protein [Deltaproteobacteria bacterium]|nr:acyl-CoA dehydrogenase family protein [Deltaproteobacteria bacterium]
MNFDPTDDQRELFDNVLAFASKALAEDPRERDAAHQFDRNGWQQAAEFGLTGLNIAGEYGGMGHDAVTTALAMEAFGQGCHDMGLVFSVAAHLFACATPIDEFGSQELKSRLLRKLAAGELVAANAATESEAGSDIHAMKTRATRDGDDYVISGAKTYVTNGPIGDVFVTYATTNPAFGYMGITAFVVERDRQGVATGQPFHKVGLRSSPTGAVYFEDCRIPVANRLGEEGQGGMIFRSSMIWERACLFACYVGMLQRQLNQVVEYARTRKQGGKLIGKYQAVSHRIVDMKLRLEAARLLVYRACFNRDQGRDATADIALAKIAVSEAAVQSGIDAIRVLGGNGVVDEYHVERMLRDAIPSTIFSGTSEIQRNLVAATLGL